MSQVTMSSQTTMDTMDTIDGCGPVGRRSNRAARHVHNSHAFTRSPALSCTTSLLLPAADLAGRSETTEEQHTTGNNQQEASGKRSALVCGAGQLAYRRPPLTTHTNEAMYSGPYPERSGSHRRP